MNPPSTNPQVSIFTTQVNSNHEEFRQKMKRNLTCPFCYVIFPDVFVLDCPFPHHSCSYCIIKRLTETQSCQKCRYKFTSFKKDVTMTDLCEDYLTHYPEDGITEEDKRKRDSPIKAKFEDSHGDIYLGYWKDGKRHGLGQITFKNGEKFYGEFENNTIKKGKMIDPNGTAYQGYWKDNKRHGKGSLTYEKDGIKQEYKGPFSDDERHGLGKIIIHDANSKVSAIKAEFIRGKSEDKGKILYKDGGRYEGDFEKDSYERGGFGVMIFPDTNIYQGNWKNNKMHGDGEIHYSDGNIYAGSWVEGVQEPRGKMKYPNGEEFLGQWVDGKFKIDEETARTDTTIDDQEDLNDSMHFEGEETVIEELQ